MKTMMVKFLHDNEEYEGIGFDEYEAAEDAFAQRIDECDDIVEGRIYKVSVNNMEIDLKFYNEPKVFSADAGKL